MGRLTDAPSRRTVFLAIVVLRDAIERCAATGPLRPPEPAVRLALAVLYGAITGPDRSRDAIDEMWRTLTGRSERDWGDHRSTWATTQLSRICRQLGIVEDLVLTRALSRAAGRETAASRAWDAAHPV